MPPDDADPAASVLPARPGDESLARPASAPASTQAPSPDRAPLVALYNATDGPNWINSENWLSDRPLREWTGIFTDRDGRVTELFLPENGLSGEIPPELGNLQQLSILKLPANELRGEIPPELGNLSNLIRLDLWNNRLTGEIPPELGNLASLVKISLAANQLTGGIPPEFANLEDLGYLDLEHNQLTGEIPVELGNLRELRLLWLSGNQLSGEIPPELADRSYLDLGDNDSARCIPQGLRNVRSDSPPSEPEIKVVDRTWDTAKLQFHDSPLQDPDRIQKSITYEVHRNDTGDSGPHQLVQSDISTNEYVDQNLSPDTTYYYLAKACNGCGCSHFFSDAVGVITEVDGPVEAPDTPTAFAGEKVNVDWAPDYARLTWQPSPRATFYQVYQGSDTGNKWELDAEFSATETEYRDYTQNTVLLFLDDTTAYAVRACNKAGCSEFSETATVN